MDAIVDAIKREPVRALYASALAAGAILRAALGQRPDTVVAVLGGLLVAGGEAVRAAVVPLGAPELVHELDELDAGDVELDVPEDANEAAAGG